MVLEMMCAAQGELKLSTGDDARELLSESREDVRNMVDMLIKNKYHLKVGFEKSGSVEYGSETDAIYGVDDAWCLQFIAKEPHIEDNPEGTYHLFGWLDMLMPEGTGYAYKESVRRNRYGRGKRACRASTILHVPRKIYRYQNYAYFSIFVEIHTKAYSLNIYSKWTILD